MRGIKRISNNPAEQTAANFMTATNAVAEQMLKRGEAATFLNAANAKTTLKQLIKGAVALINPESPNHNVAYATFSGQLAKNSEAFNELENIGHSYLSAAMKYAQSAEKAGMGREQAIDAAFNSLAGNPVFDHFGNLNLLAGQLFQEMAFTETFLTEGDAFAVPVEGGGTGLDKSRFRIPTEQVVGSAKTLMGDINPKGHIQDDANRLQINLFNEFKNTKTLEAVFSISQAMRDQALGYGTAVAPALAGFILQNRYFQAAQKEVMKLAELNFVDGLDAAGSYTSGVGGSYGMLSPAIQLALSDWAAASPNPATSADWQANPTKLVQKIQNLNYLLPSTAAMQIPTSADISLLYKDIVRLINLYALSNVNFKPKTLNLYVPSSWYGVAVQYGVSTTFNKNLDELVRTATSGIVQNIKIIPSNLMNYRATNSYGSTAGAYNYMMLVAQGCEQENKPIIMPGQTATPYIVSENVSASIMNFRAQYLIGGPMFAQYNGAYLLEFSAHT